MKLFSTILLLFISLSCFSQEFIKNSIVNFKDKTVVKGDYFYFPSIPNSVQVLDSTGKKKEYMVSEIETVEGKNCILKNINYKGTDKLFECLVQGEKLSLYKTNANDKQELYVLKDNELIWLECGKKEFEIDSKRYSKEIVTYKGILKFLMNDNPSLSKKVDKITCSEGAISDLVVAYNEGHISYIKNKETDNIKRISDWKMYTSYSNYSNFSSMPLFKEHFTGGLFNQIGVEYLFSEGSRHSFKFGLEYGKFFNKYNINFLNGRRLDSTNKTTYQYFNFNLNYYCNFLRRPKCNLYADVKLAQIGKLWGNTGSKFIKAPRFSPGFGLEYHLSNQLDIFSEINHLLIVEDFPYNFLFGVTYDI